LSLVVFVLTGIAARLIGAVHVRDVAALHAFTELDGRHVGAVCQRIVELLGPAPFTLLGLLLVAVALAQRRPRLAGGVVLVLAGSTICAEYLKPLLAQPRFATMVGSTKIPDASWPSGHSTAAMALVLCAIMVAPRRLRVPVAAAGAVFAVAVAFSLLTLDWHLPSDVVGGYLLAAVWSLFVLAALRAADARWPAGTARRLLTAPRVGPPRVGPLLAGALLAAGVPLLAMVVVLAAHGGLGSIPGQHSLVLAGAAIVAAAVALASAMARLSG
jgi:membrane-associated phospholipid phosphatase